MDKLELDERVSRLERRVSFVTALNLVMFILLAALSMVIWSARNEPTATPAIVPGVEAPPAPAPVLPPMETAKTHAAATAVLPPTEAVKTEAP
jgi:hypothetical protein